MNLLLDVAKNIAHEAKRKVALYQIFECNCPSTRQQLKTNAEEGDARITETTSKIEAGEGTVVELKIVIKVSQESCAEAKQALASAGALDARLRQRAASVVPSARSP